MAFRQYEASARTADGGNWLRVSPTSGSLSRASDVVPLLVEADTTALQPAASGLVSIKASRWLRVSLHSPTSSSPTVIKLHPSSATYDVFSLERQWEVGHGWKKRRIDLFSSGKKFSKALVGSGTLQQAVLELWNARGPAEPGGLFVAYTAK